MLLDALEWRSTIVELYLGNNRISDAGAAALAAALTATAPAAGAGAASVPAKLKTLRTLEVYINAFGEEGVKSFAAMLRV